jgi:hypothetical protein
MPGLIRRLALGAAVGMVLFAFVAAPAFATTVTTEPASNRTPTTAVLNGVIDTGGVATAWEFQWGKTVSSERGTPLQQIAAGQGSVSVSWKLTGLAPNTTYHFRVAATTGIGSYYYPLNVAFGQDRTFTTNATGRLLLLRTRLVIRNNFLFLPLRCLSGLSCVGRFTISARAKLKNGKRVSTIVCATGPFNIGKHKSKASKFRVRGGCLALLRSSPNHSHTAKLTSNARTGQHAVIRTVILVLG